jgi:hypothetical protein
MSDKTEWDIKGGNFNKPVDFPETVVGEQVYEPLQEEAVKPVDPVKVVTTKKKNRINPDALPVLYTAVALVSVLMIASFVVSFSGIYEVSAWTGLPVVLQWLPALFIDAAILAYTISLVVFKARGESTWRTLAGLTGFALVSVVANVAHTVSFWEGNLTDFRSWIGVGITAAAPIAVLLASEEITRLAFEESSN